MQHLSGKIYNSLIVCGIICILKMCSTRATLYNFENLLRNIVPVVKEDDKTDMNLKTFMLLII